ncbi:MAG: SUMF1/EgtB/PvdO family nonheme iron enzyme [Verrucomicrobia bacterium]|nr:SUMF1/EgtB/PvdO family nonheme iron enzyme [Verrucomicrobiota bacterium]
MASALVSLALLRSSPAAELSSALAPLQHPDLPNARLAVENLTKLAATQHATAKNNTEHLASVIKHLFTAEYQLEEAVKAGKKAEIEALGQERNAEAWLKPNVFGRVNEEASRASLDRAGEIRDSASKRLAAARQKLVEHLQETDSLIDDFHKILEFEVVLVLVETSATVAGRALPKDAFKSSFPPDTVASVRESLRLRGLAQTRPAPADPAAEGAPMPRQEGQHGGLPNEQATLEEKSSKLRAAAPAGFVLIPAGTFQMGDALDGDPAATPHPVTLSPFYMHPKEVSKAQWDEVRAWGLQHGYTALPSGAGKAADHPVQTVSWYDAVLWCNAKSEMEGRTPCYYTDAAQTAVYRAGSTDLDNAMVKWHASGYRLPTEAEWEKAARGGLPGKRFPAGDTLSHHEANFQNAGGESYQSGTTGYHPTYLPGKVPHTSPVGSFGANDYGLYDMAGNVVEWCWDRDGSYPATPQTDPQGAITGACRVFRGGSWRSYAYNSRVASRDNYYPFGPGNYNGFRLACSCAP